MRTYAPMALDALRELLRLAPYCLRPGGRKGIARCIQQEWNFAA